MWMDFSMLAPSASEKLTVHLPKPDCTCNKWDSCPVFVRTPSQPPNPPTILTTPRHTTLRTPHYSFQDSTSISPPADYKASLCIPSSRLTTTVPQSHTTSLAQRENLAFKPRARKPGPAGSRGKDQAPSPCPLQIPGWGVRGAGWVSGRLSFLGLDEGKAWRVASSLASRTAGPRREPQPERSIRCTESGRTENSASLRWGVGCVC